MNMGIEYTVHDLTQTLGIWFFTAINIGEFRVVFKLTTYQV